MKHQVPVTFSFWKKLSKTQFRITLAKEILWMLIYFGRFSLTGPGGSGSGFLLGAVGIS